jgi:hypothetical protein
MVYDPDSTSPFTHEIGLTCDDFILHRLNPLRQLFVLEEGSYRRLELVLYVQRNPAISCVSRLESFEAVLCLTYHLWIAFSFTLEVLIHGLV